MTCPECGGKVAVIDISHNTDTNETYRKKKCLDCNHRFQTVEFEVELDEKLTREWIKHHRHKKFIKKNK